MSENGPEAWLRGPVDGVPAPLQPVAHALLQAREEIDALVRGFDESRLWDRPSGVASVGFHLQHVAGVLDRLFTYARGEALSGAQLEMLAGEGKPRKAAARIDELLGAFDQQVERALAQLRSTKIESLAETRLVGRKQLPSTVLGLLAHAAEHIQRHVGQLLVTVRVQRDGNPS